MRLKLPKPTWRRSALIILASLLIVSTSFVVWANTGGVLMPEVDTALIGDDTVQVTQGSDFVFTPQNSDYTTGFIIYPGGRVPAAAYAPLAREIAEAGHLAAVVNVPLNLALLDQAAAGRIIENYPQVETWVVSGHSLGGVAAANYANNHPDIIDGLAFMGFYPINDVLRARDDLPIVSIYGTRDGLSTVEEILGGADLMPEQTQYIAIEGGNHAYFGWYGPQEGDNEATISRDDFTAQTVAAIVGLLEQVADAG